MSYKKSIKNLIPFWQSAFTFIELLVVIAIIAVLLTLSFPAWHSFVVQSKVNSNVSKIANALQFAKMSAIKYGKTIKYCKSKDLKTCCQSCAWRDGQIIITEDNKIINVSGELPPGDQLTFQGSFGNNDVLEFSNDGFMSQRGSFYYCPSDGETGKYAMAIIIQHTGHIRLSRYTADGKTIPCKKQLYKK